MICPVLRCPTKKRGEGGLLLGGMGTRVGPLVGAAAFALVEELVRPFGQLNVLVYGILLIVLFTAFRDGLVPLLRKALLRSIPGG